MGDLRIGLGKRHSGRLGRLTQVDLVTIGLIDVLRVFLCLDLENQSSTPMDSIWQRDIFMVFFQFVVADGFAGRN